MSRAPVFMNFDGNRNPENSHTILRGPNRTTRSLRTRSMMILASLTSIALTRAGPQAFVIPLHLHLRVGETRLLSTQRTSILPARLRTNVSTMALSEPTCRPLHLAVYLGHMISSSRLIDCKRTSQISEGTKFTPLTLRRMGRSLSLALRLRAR